MFFDTRESEDNKNIKTITTPVIEDLIQKRKEEDIVSWWEDDISNVTKPKVTIGQINHHESGNTDTESNQPDISLQSTTLPVHH